MYEILGIDPTTVDRECNFQPAYDALIERYHPTDHPDDIHSLGLFLRDGDVREYEQKRDVLQTLKKIVAEKEQPLPTETLDILSTVLRDPAQAKLHESCAELLAYCAWNEQLLSNNAIRVLETVLEDSDNSLLNIVASALNGVLTNGQTLAPNIIQLTEEALIRQQQLKSAIPSFLYQLVNKLKNKALSAATYDKLCNITLEINLLLSNHMARANQSLEFDDEEIFRHYTSKKCFISNNLLTNNYKSEYSPNVKVMIDKYIISFKV